MEELTWKEQIKEVMDTLIPYCGTANIEPRIEDIISIVEAQKLVNVDQRVSPKTALESKCWYCKNFEQHTNQRQGYCHKHKFDAGAKIAKQIKCDDFIHY